MAQIFKNTQHAVDHSTMVTSTYDKPRTCTFTHSQHEWAYCLVFTWAISCDVFLNDDIQQVSLLWGHNAPKRSGFFYRL